MEDFLSLMRSLWVVWFMVLFVGVAVWAYWPRRRSDMEDHGRIPFRDEDERS